MVVKNVSIIAIQEKYLDIITKQIKKVIGDKVKVNSITVKDMQLHTVSEDDIVVISNNLISGLVNQMIPKACSVVIAERDINYMNTQELLNLPAGQQILVVNDTKSNSDETVQSLRETVFEHNYQAYLPIETIPKSIDYIVTPGEQHLLPKGLSNVIDIGARLLDFNTIEEIVSLLAINYEKSQIVRRYIKACVSLSTNNNNEVNDMKNDHNVAEYHFEDMISISDKMNEMVQLARSYSMNESIKHIHVEGAPGTGKSMFAQAIHNLSDRSTLPFISINSTSEDFNNIEKVLLGSISEREGHDSYGALEFEEKGTICIENIENLSLTVQKNIFQVLKEDAFEARVITTSSRSYKELFDKDLIDSNLLSENLLEVPSLSERMEDMAPLIDNIKQRIQRNDISFTNEVMAFFRRYDWENNVKELYNVITYLSLLEENPIRMNFLPYYLRSKADEQKFKDFDENNEIISKIEEHGFLGESIEILNTFYEGKKKYTSYGRYALKERLEEKGLSLSEQQLRARLEVLQKLDLTIVRQGRAGTTISRKGERFIETI